MGAISSDDFALPLKLFGMLRRHILVGAAFVAVPAASLLLGDGGLAFTMYASTVEFRLELIGHPRAGGITVLAPTSLAASVTRRARPFVTGADHFRRAGSVLVLRHHLGDLARVACRNDPTLADVEVTLVERSSPASSRSTARIRCDP